MQSTTVPTLQRFETGGVGVLPSIPQKARQQLTGANVQVLTPPDAPGQICFTSVAIIPTILSPPSPYSFLASSVHWYSYMGMGQLRSPLRMGSRRSLHLSMGSERWAPIEEPSIPRAAGPTGPVNGSRVNPNPDATVPPIAAPVMAVTPEAMNVVYIPDTVCAMVTRSREINPLAVTKPVVWCSSTAAITKNMTYGP